MTLICKLKFLLNPAPAALDADAFRSLFFSLAGLKSFYIAHPFLFMLLSVLVQYVFAIVLNNAMINQRLYPQKNMLIGLAFILITSFFSECTYFSTAFIANFFLTIGFVTILKLSTTALPRQRCFNVGLPMGLASFFTLRPCSFSYYFCFLSGCCVPLCCKRRWHIFSVLWYAITEPLPIYT
ncbi:MAG: hypothetical protein IPJ31_15150 [Bacteroidetes bacterium]|nr:hypothetical protein [Bacteroidota bacterium]